MHLRKIRLDRNFQPCTPEVGEELYPNGLFVFNISRLLAFVQAHADRFPVEQVELNDIPDYGGENLDAAAIHAADVSRPVLLAEIAPARYSLIDGNHRIARARRDGARTVAARRLRCPEHVGFLTSTMAYEKYMEYWNSKVDEATHKRLGEQPRRRRSRL